MNNNSERKDKLISNDELLKTDSKKIKPEYMRERFMIKIENKDKEFESVFNYIIESQYHLLIQR